jgi:hypothetical protein
MVYKVGVVRHPTRDALSFLHYTPSNSVNALTSSASTLVNSAFALYNGGDGQWRKNLISTAANNEAK